MRVELALCALLLLLCCGVWGASAAETYTYTAKWSISGQPSDVALDSAGNVYVADMQNNQIKKFAPDGTLLTQWGSFGTGDVQFKQPWGVAVDSAGNVYVTDYWNHRVQKFTSSGVFLKQWGGAGTGDGQFATSTPMGGLTVDSAGNVYVADQNNHRIQKFTSDGVFLAKWGSYGTGNGQFNQPQDVAVDGAGNVYVTDKGNSRVQKFTSSGVFLTKWGSSGLGDGQFMTPWGITVDGAGNVFVVEQSGMYVGGTLVGMRVQKFDANGGFITKFGGASGNTVDGLFSGPRNVVVDSAGIVYVADTGNGRIQKFKMAIPLAAAFTPSVTSGQAPLTVAFTDASTGSPSAWSWDFETDGVADSTAQSPSHTYTTAGTYTATLTVTGSGGTTSKATATVTVTDPTPVANADSYTTAEDEILTVPATTGVLANDGAKSATTTATVATGPSRGTLVLNTDGSFTYTPAADFYGTDTFTYTAATGAQVSAAATVTITVTAVNDPPTAAFTFSPANPTVLDAVAFTDGSSDPSDSAGSIVGWSWDFGDGGIAADQNPSHTYAAAGTYTVTLTVTDNDGATATATDTVAVTLPPAPAVNAGGPYAGLEGAAVTLTASVTTSAPITKYEWDFNGDNIYDRTTTTSSTEYTWNDVYSGTVGVRATDAYGQQGTDSANVAIANVAPVVSGVNVPLNPVAAGTTVSTSASFTHPGTGAVTATWAWDDGATSTGTIGIGSVAGTHAYAAPGVYNVAVTVADDDGGVGTATAQTLVVVYDPNGGFVTGGGWITSPAGAYTADPAMTGKANFGFVAKYQKGATVPTGQTQFEFKAAAFTFDSTSYQWLVIAGTKAQYKGSGTVNGQGDYGFMLTAVDGSPDRFRLKVWEKGTDAIVYDNQQGAADTAGPSTALGGGSIVIHSK